MNFSEKSESERICSLGVKNRYINKADINLNNLRPV